MKLSNEFLQSNFTWAFLTHKEVGGILQGGWKIGAKVWKNLPDILRRSRVTPGIRDYVNSTVSGKEIPTLSHEEAKELGLLSGMDLLPRTDILQREVLAPSVFYRRNGAVMNCLFQN